MALPETAPPRRNARRLWLRMGVSAVLLAILVVKISSENIVPSHPTTGTLAFLVAGLLLMCGSFVLAAWRWQRVLAVFGAHVPLPTLSKHYLAGQFVGNVLPSTIGGDVLRISRSSKDVGARDMAFASVVLERLTGFVALPLLTFLGFLARPDLLHGRAWVAVLIAGATLGFLFVILVLAGSPRLAGRFAENENWMRYIGVVHVGVDRLRRDPRDATAALAFAFDEAALRSAALVVVHSWNSLPSAIWRQVDSERLAAETDKHLEEAMEPWRAKYPGVPIRRDVVHGHPARVLAAYAGRADLVVIGRHSGGHAIGGIQHAVLSHAHGPVAIVPDLAGASDNVVVPDAALVMEAD